MTGNNRPRDPVGPRRSLAGMNEDPFVTHRGLLFTVAYEMLGSAADAEDVLQESWLRWAGVDQAQVREPRAYLVRIVTRQALNQLRTVSRRREDYVGEWLPEPLLTTSGCRRRCGARRERVDRDAHGARDAHADRARGVRAARGVRRALRRDRRGGRASRPRPCGRSPIVREIMWRRVGRASGSSGRSTREVVERLVAALDTGDVQGLMDVLAPTSSRSPTAAGWCGAPRVGRSSERTGSVAYLLGGIAQVTACSSMCTPVWLNGEPGVRIEVDGALAAVVSLTVENGRITRIYSIANPDKLERLDAEAVLAR